jgi:hypothetical protein
VLTCRGSRWSTRGTGCGSLSTADADSALVGPPSVRWRRHRFIDCGDEVLDVEWLSEERGDQAVPHRGRDAGLIRLGRHQQHGRLFPVRVVPQQLEQLKARNAREVHVEDQHLNMDVAENLAGGRGVVDDRRAPARDIVEDGADQLGDGDIIFDNEDRQRLTLGTGGHGSPPGYSPG